MLVSSEGVVSTLVKRGQHAYTSCICGVLARGQNQFGPIAHALPGMVTAYHPSGKKFHLDSLVHDIVADFEKVVQYDFPINLVGASMGGQIAPFVVKRFRETYPNYDMDQFRVVLVDAPWGLPTLTDGMARLLSSRVVAKSIVGLTGAFGMMLPVGDDMLPQWDEITTGVSVPGLDDNSWAKERVVETARQDLTGHPFSLFIDSTHWIIKSAADGSLDEAVEWLSGVRTTYLRCTMGKSPIKQPLAVESWNAMLRNLETLDVAATHCGFLQNQPEFEAAFSETFGS